MKAYVEHFREKIKIWFTGLAPMHKRMAVMLAGLTVLFGSIFTYKAVKGLLFAYMMAANGVPTVTVSSMKVQYTDWQPQVKATGSLRAILGVNVTTSLAGMVKNIYFTPGSLVQEGTILVQLNADTEIGQLQSLQAQAALAKITYERDKKQYAAQAVSKQTLDMDKYNLQNLEGQVAEQAATVAKKTIRAPFTGRLGVSSVNPGQYLNAGDSVSTLQTLNPIWMDFYIPQQALSQLKIGQAVELTTDAFPGKKYHGKITTINPLVDNSTRNVVVEATISNSKFELTPGMYAYVKVNTGKPQRFLTIPQAAVTYNPYGDIVYIISDSGKKRGKKPILIVKQSFVTLGEARGDQVTVLKGLKAGDEIVTSGQLKLKNGTQVKINNTIQPANSPAPQLPDEY